MATATMVLALAAAAPAAMAKGGGHGGDRIGKGPGSIPETADSASSGKTPKLPANTKQAARRAEKSWSR